MSADNSPDSLLTRRTVVATAAGSALALAAHPAAAQRCPAAPRAKGPLVWMDMDQQELDDAYTQIAYAPFAPVSVNARGQQAREIARAKIAAPQVGRYGSIDIERVLIYRTTRPNPPTLAFLHGGAWRTGDADEPAMGEMFTKAGANFVSVDFDNIDAAGGDLFKMVDQCRRAVAWVYRNAASFGSDANRIYLAAFSSGSHLAGCVLTTDWERERLPANIVKAALLGSGMYDLKPVRLSTRSSYVKFTDAMEQALSAQRHLDRIRTPLILTHGTLETPEFQRQTKDFVAALQAAGKPVRLLVGNGHNHFEMIESMVSPYGIMGRAALEVMNLAV
jgi:arylformamidase